MLGFALFERHVRHLVVTEKGMELAVTVSHLLNELRLKVAALREDSGNEKLRILCTHSFAMKWLLPRLHRYTVRHPEVDIRIESDDEVVDVSRDACDIAIRHQRYVAGDDSNLLWREQLLLAYASSLLSARDQEATQSPKLKRLLRYPLLYESTPENWLRLLQMHGMTDQHKHLHFCAKSQPFRSVGAGRRGRSRCGAAALRDCP